MPEFLTERFGPNAPLILPLLRILGMLVMAWTVFRLLDSALRRLHLVMPSGNSARNARIEQRAITLRSVVRSAVKIVVIVVVVLTIVSELGFSVAGVLASVGVASLAIGFGAQSLVKDVIAGFFILFEDQFGVGDAVRIAEYSGVVEHMTLRVVVLRNFEGEVHIIPNGNIQSVTVMTKDWARAVVDVTVAHGEDLDKVFKALETVGAGLAKDWPERIIEEPSVLGIEGWSIDGVTIRSAAKTTPSKKPEVVREWRRRIKEEFDRSRIDLPQRATVWMEPERRKAK